MDRAILRDCLAQAFAGRMTFPETVGRMMETGVERYNAELTRLRKMHYGADGSTPAEVMPLADAPAVPAERVQAAIEAMRRREIEDPEFLRRIMAAGTARSSRRRGRAARRRGPATSRPRRR
jgi:hypothetical protein